MCNLPHLIYTRSPLSKAYVSRPISITALVIITVTDDIMLLKIVIDFVGDAGTLSSSGDGLLERRICHISDGVYTRHVC